MSPSIFLNNHVPPAIFPLEDYLRLKRTIQSILNPHRTFIKNHFNKGKLVSLKGYALEKVVDGKYEHLSALEILLLFKGLAYLGCLEEEAPNNFRDQINCGGDNMSLLWLADIEPNLVLCLQLYNRVARICNDEINAHIYNFKDNLRYYGYFNKGHDFSLHEVDHINQAYRKTTRSDLIKIIPKLSKYLNRAGCKALWTGGNMQKLMLDDALIKQF